jgi:hypothetical protein
VQAMGVQVREVEVVRYPLQFTLREELDRFSTRTGSETWDIPDEIFDASMTELRTWAESEFDNLNGPRQDELLFAVDVVRFGSNKTGNSQQ